MPDVATAVLRKQIASGETDPLYALVGGDDVEKAAVATEFAEMVEEGLRAFNVERLYGGEIKVSDLFDAAHTLPMMAPRRVVIVHEAERLFIPKRESQAAEEELERLEAFLKAAPAHATIVFVCGDMDRRRRAVKQLMTQAQVVKCGVIESDADAEHWIKVRAAQDRITARSGDAPRARRANRARRRASASSAGTRQPVRDGAAGDHAGGRPSGGARGSGGSHGLRHCQRDSPQ